jgi:LacI family transcriptional regulator
MGGAVADASSAEKLDERVGRRPGVFAQWRRPVMRDAMPDAPIVNFAGDVSYSFTRGILRGVSRFSRTQGHWKFNLDPYGAASVLRRAENGAHIDGIVGQFYSPDLVDRVLNSRVPAVNVSNRSADERIPKVISDDRVIGELAARHFIERGFKSFAYVGMGSDVYFSRVRGDGFINLLKAEGITEIRARGYDESLEAVANTQNAEGRRDFLRGLPEQTAVFACNDRMARACIEEALAIGYNVPDRLAVLGVDNDEIDCELSPVPLSSVQLSTEKVGYEAAQLLAQLIAREQPPQPVVLVLPVNVVTRQSSDVLAVNDTEVLAALRYIREHATKGIQVGDVVGSVSLSRRMLELRFRRAMNRTVHDEIQRIRVEQAKRLLAESDLPVGEIAVLAGFKEAFYLSTSFRKATGMTPRAYRAQFRLS